MKMTLLEMVQEILRALESDNVNTIGETQESLDVAGEIKTTYFSTVVPVHLPEHKKMILLEGVGDVSRPNYLRLPVSVKATYEVYYDVGTPTLSEVRTLEYVEPRVFVNLHRNNSDNKNFRVVDFDGVPYYINTNENPRYYTSFDDTNLIVNSINRAIDDTLVGSKAQAFVSIIPEFRIEDNFIPVLDANLFPQFLSEAKNACFVNMKQVSNSLEQQRSRQLAVRTQSDRYRAYRETEKHPNYGRPRA